MNRISLIAISNDEAAVSPEGRAPNFVSRQGRSCALRHVLDETTEWWYEPAGRYLVTAGMPVGPDPEAAVARLLAWSTKRRRTPILFGIEPADLSSLPGWRVREIGRQPLFQAHPDFSPRLSGPNQPERGREMRRQARRAMSKAVDWVELSGGELWEWEQRGRLTALLRTRWSRQPLAEFSFLVALHPGLAQHHRRYFLLLGQGQEAPLGLAILLRSDRGWLVEHQLIGRRAPNGSGELLACRLLAERLLPGEWLSLGITPLYRALVPGLPHQEVLGILSFLPEAARGALVAAWEPLYGFRSLQLYREKLRPDRWEPVYWASRGGWPPFILRAVLRVFAGESLPSFALASAGKLLSKLSLRFSEKQMLWGNRLFLWSLCLWIPVLWQLDGKALFGTAVAPRMWALYDLVLAAGFASNGATLGTGRAWRGLPFLLGLVSADALLSLLWTVLLHGGCQPTAGLAFFLTLLNAAPLAAAVFLLLCWCRHPVFLRHGGRTPLLENP